MRAPVIFGLAVSLAIALTLQILACALYDNWWPLLTGAWYVIVPAPFLFLSGGSADSYTSMGGGGDESWEDLAKFLAGFSGVGTIAVPVVLTHARLIQRVQLALALPSAILLAATAAAYSVLNRQEDYY